MSESAITLYTHQTPNGIKISITLEELGLPYKIYNINSTAMEQKSDWFLEINPNGRIPAIVDKLEDGSPIQVFESGSIMQYLVQRYDKDYKISYPPGSREQIEMTNWLFWQMAGIGPMQGQANHFIRYCPGGEMPYAISRYTNETKRLYGVLEKHLTDSKSEYIVGDKCTIADISCWGWVSLCKWCNIDLSEFPALKAWDERMFERPAVEKGRQVPEKHQREMLQDPKAMEEMEAKARDFYKRMAEEGKMTKEGV